MNRTSGRWRWRQQGQLEQDAGGTPWTVASVAAIGAVAAALSSGCRAPDDATGDDPRAISSRALSLATVPLATAPALSVPAIKTALDPPLACDQAVAQGATPQACIADGTGWRGRLLVATSKSSYCHFTWDGTDPPDLARLRAPGRTVEPDCSVVGLASPTPTLDPGLWKGLATTFRRQAGYARWRPPVAGPEITVVAVDSAVRDYVDPNADDTFGHGRLVGRTVADLACPLDPFLVRRPDSCRLTIENALALPRVPDAIHPGGIVDASNGGYFGSRGEMGEAIARALSSWELGRTKGSRLILNLSLGWEGSLPTTLQSNIASEAIATLLARASCEGALSIAAAGNQIAAKTTGAFLPAAWEGRAAPGRAECLAQWPDLIVDDSASKPRPLVYAAAAVDVHDRPLLTARPSGSPRLQAMGIAAVTEDQRAPGHTQILSGSSIAAAVVSGVAAAVWQTAGALGGPAVMEIVYKSGVDLTAPAASVTAPATTLCLNPPCDAPHRVSLCGALQQLSASIGAPAPTCDVVAAGDGKEPLVPPAIPALAGTATCASCPPGPPPAAETPWVWPQPSGAACPSCLFVNSCSGFGGAGVVGQIDPRVISSVNTLVDVSNAKKLPSAVQAQVTSVAARVVRDSQPSDFGLGSTLSPDVFWLEQPGAANQAAISFTVSLAAIPLVKTVTTTPQDIPVICQ